MINHDEFKPIEIHWIALYVNVKVVTYFDSLQLSIFQKKLENSWEIKTLQQIVAEYKHTIQAKSFYCLQKVWP